MEAERTTKKAPAGAGTPIAGATIKTNHSIPQEEKMSNETTTITSLELENIKRIKAVQIMPTATGLTVIGGNNNQGKTSVLDAIMWILGGNNHRPSQPKREGSMSPYAPTLRKLTKLLSGNFAFFNKSIFRQF